MRVRVFDLEDKKERIIHDTSNRALSLVGNTVRVVVNNINNSKKREYRHFKVLEILND